jgi:hypothetical protein
MIRAFATRTASALGDRFFESGVSAPAPAVGIMSSWVGAIELCGAGCTLIGPADVGLRFGILDNSQMQSLFTALQAGRYVKRPAALALARVSGGRRG